MKIRLQKRSILMIVLATVLALATGLAVLFASPAFADTANARANEQAPVATYYLGSSGLEDSANKVYYRSNFVNGWNEAVGLAKSEYSADSTAYVKVVLAKDWKAESNGFGTTGNFSAGRLLVPSASNILIDLNGNDIDRNLSEATVNGHAILVEGNLTVVDSTYGRGSITGGYNRASSDAIGGGVLVTGTFNLKSGSIKGNKVQGSNVFGAGVAVNGGTFNMYDGSITGNVATATGDSYGGGVCVYTGTFNMYDGVISNGNATYGGGVATYNASSLTIAGGTIYSNTATKDGGGIYVNKNSVNVAVEANIKGGDIFNNTADNGGGIATVGSSGSAIKVNMTAGNISSNSAKTLGGGIYLSNTEISLSGHPQILNNYKAEEATVATNMLVLASSTVKVAGKLDDEAVIYLNLDDGLVGTGKAFTSGYGEHNGKFVSYDGREPDYATPTNGIYAYANPYKYFSVDASTVEKHLVVLSNGELGVSAKAVKFTVTYSNSVTKDFIFGESSENGDLSEWNYVEAEYNAGTRPTLITAYVNNEKVGDSVLVNNQAGRYTLTSKIDSNSELQFHAIIKAKELTADDVDVYLQKSGYKYTGSEIKVSNLTVTIKGEGEPLVNDSDYELTYENNINAGTATVIITFINNYTGSISDTFTINAKDDPSIFTSIEWQVYNGANWGAYNADAFTYDGTDQSTKIRAKLSYTEGSVATTRYAYVQGIDEADVAFKNNWNRNVCFVIQLDSEYDASKESVAFVDAGDYYMTIVGDSNYSYATDAPKTQNVKMNSRTSNFTEDDLDLTDVNMWKVQIGSGSDVAYSSLLYNKETEVYYARYRGVALSLVLNENYVLAKDGIDTIADLLKGATVTYTHNGENGGVLGSADAVTKVTTAVKIIFSDSGNFNNAVSKIEFTFNWQIVTMSNGLRSEDGSSEVYDSELEGWTFGLDGEIKGYTFRPEYGDTLIYTYYKLGNSSAQKIGQFALVYSDNTLDATKQFYGVKTENDNVVVDTENLLGGENYLYLFNYQLKAGSYRMEVTIPASAVSDTELSYNFDFTVDVYQITTGADGLDPNITIEFSSNTAEYTGTSNAVVSPVITLFRKVLVEGVDYTLSSNRVNIGTADLIIHGNGSLSGDIVIKNAYEIVKARNGWHNVPTIMHWTYFGFDKEVNLISATPYFIEKASDMWFSIAYDSEGNNLVEGLEKFIIEEGVVSDKVAELLNGLPANTYYLIGHVEGSDNYYELEPQCIPFTVFRATNSWEISPSVNSWTEGKYNSDEEYLLVSPAFGKAHIVITDEKGNVYYDNEAEINKLADAKAGHYILKASVLGSDNYSGLDEYTFMFDVFEKPGLPWWAALLITVGALGLAALIILILYKKGVFQIVTEKIVVAIRTRASVEATIASVRAAKMMEEGRKSVEEAKRRELLESMNKNGEAQAKPEPQAETTQEKAPVNNTPDTKTANKPVGQKNTNNNKRR